MAKMRQIGIVGSSIRTLELPTPTSVTYGSGERFYTLTAPQEGYEAGHIYKTVVDDSGNYYWEDVSVGAAPPPAAKSSVDLQKYLDPKYEGVCVEFQDPTYTFTDTLQFTVNATPVTSTGYARVDNQSDVSIDWRLRPAEVISIIKDHLADSTVSAVSHSVSGDTILGKQLFQIIAPHITVSVWAGQAASDGAYAIWGQADVAGLEHFPIWVSALQQSHPLCSFFTYEDSVWANMDPEIFGRALHSGLNNFLNIPAIAAEHGFTSEVTPEIGGIGAFIYLLIARENNYTGEYIATASQITAAGKKLLAVAGEHPYGKNATLQVTAKTEKSWTTPSPLSTQSPWNGATLYLNTQADPNWIVQQFKRLDWSQAAVTESSDGSIIEAYGLVNTPINLGLTPGYTEADFIAAAFSPDILCVLRLNKQIYLLCQGMSGEFSSIGLFTSHPSQVLGTSEDTPAWIPAGNTYTISGAMSATISQVNNSELLTALMGYSNSFTAVELTKMVYTPLLAKNAVATVGTPAGINILFPSVLLGSDSQKTDPRYTSPDELLMDEILADEDNLGCAVRYTGGASLKYTIGSVYIVEEA